MFGVAAAPVAGVMEMERVPRHVLGGRDHVLAIRAEGHQLVGRHQLLADEGARITRLPLGVGGDDAALGDGAGAALRPVPLSDFEPRSTWLKGAIWEIPDQVWAIAIYLVTTNLKGVSSMKLHRDLGEKRSPV